MSLLVQIAAEFTGIKAFRKADNAVTKLEKSVKSLGRALGVSLTAAAFVSFAKAAAADEAAAAKLANAVKNLGMEFANPYIADYISKMEQQTKVADDELRPAFQALITQTSSLAKSQELLSTAINVSRGSGESLATVANDLAQAYAGNTKGLKKYYLGLTSAQLAAASFTEIQTLLNKQFSGASTQYLNTYQGQIDTLSLAFGNLQESAGRAFFTLIGGAGGSAGGANTFGRFLEGVGIGLEKTAQSISDWFVRQTMSQDAFDAYLAKRNQAPAPTPGKELFKKSSSNDYVLMKLEKDRQALIKKQLNAQKALTAEQKKQAALKKAGTIFDLAQIQIIAALKGDLSDEERKRLELQLALETENVTEAKKLTYELAIAQGLGVKLAQDLASLPAASNPFAAWKGYLDEVELQAKRIAAFTPMSVGAGIPATSGTDFGGNKIGTPVPNFTPPPSGTYGIGGGAPVVVQIDGKTIASALMDQSLSGNQAYVNRRTGGFD